MGNAAALSDVITGHLRSMCGVVCGRREDFRTVGGEINRLLRDDPTPAYVGDMLCEDSHGSD